MLSCVILAKNEEKNLSLLLPTLNFCDEILIIDDGSTDNTALIARKYKIDVIRRKLIDFSGSRNFGLKKAIGDWILFIDADERIDSKLAGEIQSVIKENNEISAYYIKRRDVLWGREVVWGELFTASQKGFIRLVKKDCGRWQGAVHENFFTDCKTAKLQNHLLHYPHEGISDFLHSVNHFSSLLAKDRVKNDKKISILEVFFVPSVKFFYTFFLKLGFLDRERGFIYSFMMSFHSFLVRSKAYFLQKEKK